MEKKYVFLISRTHPGETISSLMIERVVKYLTSNEKEAVELRHAYVFKIIAMVNPDGVLHGNSRCSLPGRDLNRSWDKIDQYLFP
jgi:murein tripeptide amidase MpaA